MNDKIEHLSAEVSKRDRAVLQLENQKEALQNQLRNKEKEMEEMRQDKNQERNSLAVKIEDLKIKYEKAMDDLTQTKIDNERDKALKE